MSEIAPGIIDECKAGSLAALEAIYRTYGERVFRIARRVLGSDADADDATQQVFVRVHRQISKYDGRAAFSTWLYRVTVNHCLNMVKGRRFTLSLSEIDADALVCNGTTAPVDAEDSRLLERLLDALDPEDRSLIVLKEVEGLTYRQLSETLDIPMGTVMSRLHRARTRLLDGLDIICPDRAKRGRDRRGSPVKRIQG